MNIRRSFMRHIIRSFTLIGALLAAAMIVAESEDSYAAQWGPSLNTEIPTLTVLDVEGNAKTVSDLAGEQGLVIFFVRSSDW